MHCSSTCPRYPSGMRQQHLWLGPARLPFLVLTPACIVLGLACVHWTQGQVNLLQATLVLLGALAAHVSVNAFNEHHDFHSGLDALTQRTPFSGGSGVLPAHPELAGTTLVLALGALGICLAVGLYFVALRRTALLPLGLVGVALVLTYTRWLTRQPLLCLVAPGLGFGPLMILGTQVALTGHYSVTAVAASLVPFCLVNNLLLLNQFPDEAADRQVGRRHLLVTIGPKISARWYASFMALAYVSLLLGVLFKALPQGALLGGLTAPLAWFTVRRVLAHAQDVAQLLPALRQNVLINLLTPVLMAVGMWL